MNLRRPRLTFALVSALAVSVGVGGLLLFPPHSAHAEQGDKTLYTCSMHPQILQEEPGTCPICGMNLVPKKVSAKGGAKAAPGAAKGDASAKDGKSGGKIKYWVAPMDPTYRRDGPGKSPMGMDLVPVYEDEGSDPNLVEIDPVVVQDIGVRTAVAERGSIHRNVRTVGTVEPAEDLLSVVNLRFSGWIEKIHVDETGVYVKKGDPLFDVYSPELVSAEDEYLVGIRTAGAHSALAKSARRRLELFGLAGWQIDRLAKRGASRPTLTITSPRDGWVLHKTVVEGARVQAGKDLYRIAELNPVWIEAEVYEFDAPFVQVGQPADVELTFQPGVTRQGEVSYVYPTLNERTRTLRVRIALDNPDLELKPGSFATVQIDTQAKQGVVLVPSESVIHSGTRELLFVAQSLGKFEARNVVTGVSGDDGLTEIRSGVEPGERVVTSAQFLLDSESQLREAVQKMMEKRLQSKSPQAAAAKSGADTPSEEAHASAGDAHAEDASASSADTYWTCSMHPQIVQDGPGTCPVCGMNLVEKQK